MSIISSDLIFTAKKQDARITSEKLIFQDIQRYYWYLVHITHISRLDILRKIYKKNVIPSNDYDKNDIAPK